MRSTARLRSRRFKLKPPRSANFGGYCSGDFRCAQPSLATGEAGVRTVAPVFRRGSTFRSLMKRILPPAHYPSSIKKGTTMTPIRRACLLLLCLIAVAAIAQGIKIANGTGPRDNVNLPGLDIKHFTMAAPAQQQFDTRLNQCSAA